MTELLEFYIKDVFEESEPKVKHINMDYLYSTKILFTYTHKYNESNNDIKKELNIWDLLSYTFTKLNSK